MRQHTHTLQNTHAHTHSLTQALHTQAYAPEGKGDRKVLAEKVGAEHYARAVNNVEDYRRFRV